MTIARRFIGGITRDYELKSVKRTVETERLTVSRPLPGLNRKRRSFPALKRWAIFSRPLRGRITNYFLGWTLAGSCFRHDASLRFVGLI